MNIQTLPQKEVEVGGHKYLITALGASEGLKVISKLSEGDVNSEFIRNLIINSVAYENMKRDVKWFDNHFARRYKDIQELYEEVIAFNLGDDPKDSGDM